MIPDVSIVPSVRIGKEADREVEGLFPFRMEANANHLFLGKGGARSSGKDRHKVTEVFPPSLAVAGFPSLETLRAIVQDFEAGG